MANYNNIKLTKSLFYGGMLLLSLSGLLTFTYLQNKDEGTFEEVSATVAPASQDPIGGSVYKEVKLKWPDNDRSWRVNNPLCTNEKCLKLLPNRVLQFTDLSYISEPYTENAITEQDLGADTTKVQFIIDRWGGHDGNQNEKFNINVTPDDTLFKQPSFYKYTMPDIDTLPTQGANRYYHHDNPVLDLSKTDFQPGNNTLHGYTGNGNTGGFWQWGWTSAVLRFYFNPASRLHATAEVDVPNTFSENPTIKLKSINLPQGETIESVEYVGYYRGVDEDGDGYYTDWHEGYFSPRKNTSEGSFEVSGHIGTATNGPDYAVVWSTRFVPDQQNASIKIIARIKTSNNIWYITPIKSGLTLSRSGASVKMYTATNIPEKYGSRNNNLNDVVRVIIPSSDSSFVNSASEAAMFWRTWNGHSYEWGYNSYSATFEALNHAFHQSFYNVPVNKLVAGSGANDGKVWIRANTEDHALEVAWPGPALIVRTGDLLDTPTPTTTSGVTPTITPTGTPGASLTPTVTPSWSTTPTLTQTPGATLTPTLTQTPGASPTPTITPTGTIPASTPTVTPTEPITGNICGKADVDGNGIFDINDFTGFAQAYGDGRKSCGDSQVDYGPCRGRDADRNGFLDINDFGGYGVGFAQRYYPKTSCAL